jgi:SPX domain protein involved in polyphosphate accumulation
MATPQANKLWEWLKNAVRPHFSTPNDFRFEKKFVLPLAELPAFEMRLEQLGYSPLHQARWINNLYIDTFDYQHYYENIDGLSQRKKIRFRWYGSPPGFLPVTAELKIKNDDTNRKESIALGNFDIASTPNFDFNHLFEQFKQRWFEKDAHTAAWIEAYQATLHNRYYRKYYAHPGENIRLTMDTPIFYIQAQTHVSAIQEEFAILELKAPFTQIIDSDIAPLQLHKSSKYVEGLQQTDPRFMY